MTTSKVIGVRVPEYLYEEVKQFQETHNLTSQGEALRLLLEAGLTAGDAIVDWSSLETIQANARSAAIEELYDLVARVLREKGYTK